MYRVSLLAALALCHFGCTTLANAENQRLTLLTEINPPYNYLSSENGALTGSAVEIVTELLQRTNISYEMRILPWRRAYKHALEDVNTCVFAMNRTPSREELFQWVSPLVTGGWSIFKLPNSPIKINSLEDIKKYRLVGKTDSAAVDTLEKETCITVVTTTGDELAARMLYHGRADLWISGVVDGPRASVAAGLPEPETAYAWKKAELALGCSKTTDPAIIARLNLTLKELEEFRQAAIARH